MINIIMLCHVVVISSLSFSSRSVVTVTLSPDKNGPIYDCHWAPNGKEFAVCYGYMPAKGWSGVLLACLLAC